MAYGYGHALDYNVSVRTQGLHASFRSIEAPNASNAVNCTTSADTGTRGVPSPTSTQWTGSGCLCLPCHGANERPADHDKSCLGSRFCFPCVADTRRAARELRFTALVEHQQQQRANESVRKSGRPGNPSSPRSDASSCPTEVKPREYDSLTFDELHRLRVVGRGAFGQVMLVRRKVLDHQNDTRLLNPRTRMGMDMTPQQIAGATGGDTGKVYAMKVIKKAAVFAKNQVEHTKTERRILPGVDHPFLVKLRYAF
ncbi:hypothetical protein PsorP6_014942 [Peronosclerospora sorghi]|uniref:Uncharacterized protein n=1 Tax=Peronosclerospora sorghi TaxID=230839 RepID=A0ACC0VSU0_9STRA|nr:hypothetical protein PsorP6_014942 [Peronosclerospora sorghi]